jgi:signal peptidase I
MVMTKVRTKDGVGHVVTKKKTSRGIGKKGDVIVDHTSKKKGKYDKMNLTKVAKSKTVKDGVKATRKWHSENPQKKTR